MRYLTILALSTTAGCLDLDGNGNGNGHGGHGGETTIPDTALLRVMNLSATAPHVDAFVDQDSTPATTDLAYGDVATLDVEPESGATVKFTPTGAPPSDAIATAKDVDFADGTAAVSALYGPAFALKTLTYVDDPSDVAHGQIRMRFSHVAHDVGSVDVWMTKPDRLLVRNLAYGATQAQDLDRPVAGSVIALDLDQDGHGDLRFELPDLADADQVDVFVDGDAHGAHLLFLQGNDIVKDVQADPAGGGQPD